jgi:hypothetical protein
MKYELTENVKKAINEFEEILKIFVNPEKIKKEDIEYIKQKLEYAIKIIQEMED